MELQSIKQRFGIIGNSPALGRAIDIARQVAPTDLSVLITGESGTGKEVFPKIIHHYSTRKHGTYIAVNCGAIPEGTIDSELFGHEKGAFTGATDSRQGYFEVANGGTIFLDEVAELPMSTQARLLRVLESGDFIRVGSSKVHKTNVRVVAATNVNLPQAIQEGRFREDLYYRLNTVPISIPALRERPDDIALLFRKFAADFAEKYSMPAVRLNDEARKLLSAYKWPGNVRQLKNVTEQISIIEQQREVDAECLNRYLPDLNMPNLPAIYQHKGAKLVDEQTFASEREILYKILFDMRNDVNDLKRLVHELMRDGNQPKTTPPQTDVRISDLAPLQYGQQNTIIVQPTPSTLQKSSNVQDTEEFIEESLTLKDREIDHIKQTLDRNNGRRKQAAAELGISERTLYRKLRNLQKSAKKDAHNEQPTETSTTEPTEP
ncbi:MAG: sigma-54-dependent Fis family transcriptional regulator [Bacteroidales bacterium]|nr:sigma-54-dependent Fis family transcriptional regulator [Bacteroidales bacterium]